MIAFQASGYLQSDIFYGGSIGVSTYYKTGDYLVRYFTNLSCPTYTSYMLDFSGNLDFIRFENKVHFGSVIPEGLNKYNVGYMPGRPLGWIKAEVAEIDFGSITLHESETPESVLAGVTGLKKITLCSKFYEQIKDYIPAGVEVVINDA